MGRNAWQRQAFHKLAVPYLGEDMLKDNDGRKGADWTSFVVDGKLVTGQNPASSKDAARKLLDMN
jgi:putative intracellular protease/amidase